MNHSTIRIGSRDSQLAMKQAQIVMEKIRQARPDLHLELVTMKTTGDRILDRRLDQIGGKGLFVKELDQALRDDRIDLSVHSLKDMPMEVPEDLPLMAFTEREDPRDVMIFRNGMNEERLQKGSIIGSSSQRRIMQLQQLYPECEYKSIRGNVQTRLRKLKEEDYCATVLALAGIRRLGMEKIIDRYFSTEEILPAAGQGIIAVQGRKGEFAELMDQINCKTSQIAACCERSFVSELNGGCSSPIAAYAEIKGEELVLSGMFASSEKGILRKGRIEGHVSEAEEMGYRLARQLKGQI